MPLDLYPYDPDCRCYPWEKGPSGCKCILVATKFKYDPILPITSKPSLLSQLKTKDLDPGPVVTPGALKRDFSGGSLIDYTSSTSIEDSYFNGALRKRTTITYERLVIERWSCTTEYF